MANTIKLKKSSVAAKVPLTSDLDYGELAINYNDGNLFFKNSSNTVQTIASTQFVSVTGNVTGGNINTAGNVAGNYFIGDGSQLTGIAQSTALLGDGGGMGLANHPVTSTGDAGAVTAAATDTQDLGSITQSPIPVQYVARDVDILSVVSVTGNITVGNILTDGYYYANGTPFAGGGGNYTDANVATFLSTSFGSNVIVTTGNITAGNINATLLSGTLTPAAQANITAVGTLGSLDVTGNVTGGNLTTGGLINATGNITGGNITTAGVLSATGNTNVGNLSTAGLISATGNITGGNVTGGNINGTAGIYGNIFTTLIDSADSSAITVTPELVCASDLTIQNDLFVNRIDSQDSGEILVTPAVRMESDLQVENALTVRQEISTLSVTATGSVTASQYFGDGGSLSNIATLTQAAGLAIALGS